MTKDSSLCIVPPQTRTIWIDPQLGRYWTRDSGNSNVLGNTVPGFNFINYLQTNQKNFKNLVLQNKVPPSRGNGSMSNVDGRVKKTSFYSYLSNVKSNPYNRNQTYATQKSNGTYTNPNTHSDKLKIVEDNNGPAILNCISEPEP